MDAAAIRRRPVLGTLDGEVTSAMLGADFSRNVGAVGLMLTLSSGEGSYRGEGEGEGEVESTLTSLYPYGRYALNNALLLGVCHQRPGTR